MDEKLCIAIEKIKQLAEQNPEFAEEMQKAFGKSFVAPMPDAEVKSDIATIREALGIRANVSIDYDFVSDVRVRDQLIVDNLRMENAALCLSDSYFQRDPDAVRFYNFCVNAFYQVENIVNFYLYKKFPDFEDLLNYIEEKTAPDGSYAYRRIPSHDTLDKIPIANKAAAVCYELMDLNFKISVDSLRKLRNEGEHRCVTAIRDRVEDSQAYKFYKYNSFNTVRGIVSSLVFEIKCQMI